MPTTGKPSTGRGLGAAGWRSTDSAAADSSNCGGVATVPEGGAWTFLGFRILPFVLVIGVPPVRESYSSVLPTLERRVETVQADEEEVRRVHGQPHPAPRRNRSAEESQHRSRPLPNLARRIPLRGWRFPSQDEAAPDTPDRCCHCIHPPPWVIVNDVSVPTSLASSVVVGEPLLAFGNTTPTGPPELSCLRHEVPRRRSIRCGPLASAQTTHALGPQGGAAILPGSMVL